MITASINKENTLITDVEDQNGKRLTICSSKVESEYLSPRQLVQSALAGCLSMTIRRELLNRGIEFEDVVVKVDQEERVEGTALVYEIIIESNADYSIIDEVKKDAVNNCYIRGLLENGIQIAEGRIEEYQPVNFDRCCD